MNRILAQDTEIISKLNNQKYRNWTLDIKIQIFVFHFAGGRARQISADIIPVLVKHWQPRLNICDYEIYREVKYCWTTITLSGLPVATHVDYDRIKKAFKILIFQSSKNATRICKF